MNYIQYMKPGGTTENKKETSKFIEWLNKAGQSWKDFWDKPVTVQYAYNPHVVVGNGGAPFSSTQRREDFATQAAGALAIPATAAGVATVGLPATAVGMVAGIGAGAAGSAGGSKLIELVGGDENAQEMAGDIAGFALGTLAGGKATKATTNYLNLWNLLLSPRSIYTAMAEGLAPTTTQNYGLVKYYGPTMGKTTAAKTNPKLVDFDDIVRGPIAELAAKKGVTPRDLKIANDPDYISLLEAEVARWRMNPANAGKTLVISNKALSSSITGYNNLPSIPDKETFIARQVLRGGTREEAAAYYDALIENNPNLKIDNRFVSDIESGTRAAKISEAERLGIPKGERNSVLIDRGQLSKIFRWIDGELVPEYKQRTLGDDIPLWDAKNWDIHDGKVYTDADGVNIYKFRPPKVEPLDFTKSPIVNWGNELPEASFTRWDRMLNRPVTRAEFLRPPWQSASEADIRMSKILKSVSENSKVSEKLISDFDNAMIEARFRLFYYNKGYYLSEDLTRRDIAKIVADNYAQLTATLQGKLKNLILWNGSSGVKQFDNATGQFTTIREAAPENFTIIKNGYRTAPSDRAGIYFNTQPVGYDLTRVVTQGGFVGRDLIESFPNLIEYSVTKGDKLPYLINKVNNVIREYWPENLKQLPEGTVFNTTQNKGNLITYPQDPLKAHEFFVQSPENIKSLFPHPNLFVENADGTWSMIRSWDNPGLHYKSGGTIKIKKKNRGKFTASAKAAGEGVQEHAHKVMNDPNATPLQKKRANFAIQAKKWHRKHQLGGKINYLNIF